MATLLDLNPVFYENYTFRCKKEPCTSNTLTENRSPKVELSCKLNEYLYLFE